MSIVAKMWDGIAKVIRMDAKVEALALAVKEQHVRLESMNNRLVRAETLLEIATSGSSQQITLAAKRKPRSK